MTFALPSIKEAILNPEFKKSGKIRWCQVPARHEIRQCFYYYYYFISFALMNTKKLKICK